MGLISFGALFTEGSITDWGSVYVKNVLEGSPAVAGAALATFGAGMALSRLSGDHLRSRFGAVALLTVGASLTPVALAAAGFVESKGGVASSVASVVTIGYVGFLMGPALIGLLTTALSLPGALCSLVVAMGAVLLLARQVGVADEV